MKSKLTHYPIGAWVDNPSTGRPVLCAAYGTGQDASNACFYANARTDVPEMAAQIRHDDDLLLAAEEVIKSIARLGLCEKAGCIAERMRARCDEARTR